MPVTRTTISLEWLTEQSACNLDALKKYFAKRGVAEVELTPEGLARALNAGILSCNWLARRILAGEEKEYYEREMAKAMKVYEQTMTPVLMAIIRRARNL